MATTLTPMTGKVFTDDALAAEVGASEATRAGVTASGAWADGSAAEADQAILDLAAKEAELQLKVDDAADSATAAQTAESGAEVARTLARADADEAAASESLAAGYASALGLESTAFVDVRLSSLAALKASAGVVGALRTVDGLGRWRFEASGTPDGVKTYGADSDPSGTSGVWTLADAPVVLAFDRVEGARRDGVNVATQFAALVNVARATGAVVDLGVGGTIRANLTSTLNIAGVRFKGDAVTLDLSGMTAATAFEAKGTRTAVATGLAVSGQVVTLPAGLGLKAGDRLFFTTTSQAAAWTASRLIYKGETQFVGSYNDATGRTVLGYPMTLSLTGATAWTVSEAAVHFSDGIAFKGDGAATTKTGFLLDMARVSGSLRMEGFGQKGVILRNTRGTLQVSAGAVAEASAFAGLNYGIAVEDLSDVELIGCSVATSRHAYTIGGGTWNLSESGGASGAAAYPGRLTVTGGRWASYGENLGDTVQPSFGLSAGDSHGAALLHVINGGTYSTGLSLAARTVILNSPHVRHCYSAGVVYSDCENVGWGYVSGHVTIEGLPGVNHPAVQMDTDQKLARMAVTYDIVGDYANRGSAYNAPLYLLGEIVDFASDFRVTSTASGGARLSQVWIYHTPRRLGLECVGATVRVSAKAALVSLAPVGSSVSAPAQGLEVLGTDALRWRSVDLSRWVSRKAQTEGVEVQYAERVTLGPGTALTGNSLASTGTSSGLVANLVGRIVCSGSDLRGVGTQRLGIRHNSGLSGRQELVLSDADTEGCTLATYFAPGGTVYERPGCIGHDGVRRLTGAMAWDPPSLATGAQASINVTCPGAVLGMRASAGLTTITDATALELHAVASTGVVKVTLVNRGAATVDLASGTLSVAAE